MPRGNVALLVEDRDSAIRFFVDALGFELVEDSPALIDDGRPKRWVMAYPCYGCNPGAAQTGDRVADTGSFRYSRPYQT